MRTMISIGISLGLCIALASSAVAVGPNEPLPAVTLRNANGTPAALQIQKGKVTYVDFWASWCPPCQESLPWMNTLVDKYSDRGLNVVAISVDRETSQAEKALKRVNPRFQVLFDPEGNAAKTFGVPSMPTSYLIDKNGEIVHVHRGFKSCDKEPLESEIATLLGSVNP